MPDIAAKILFTVVILSGLYAVALLTGHFDDDDRVSQCAADPACRQSVADRLRQEGQLSAARLLESGRRSP